MDEKLARVRSQRLRFQVLYLRKTALNFVRFCFAHCRADLKCKSFLLRTPLFKECMYSKIQMGWDVRPKGVVPQRMISYSE